MAQINQAFEDELEFSEKYKDEMRALLGIKCIKKADIKTDMRDATDYVMPRKDIAFRLRRHPGTKLFKIYKEQFTIRGTNKYGDNAELKKMVDGKCDLMIYAFEDRSKSKIHCMKIIDIDVLREQWDVTFTKTGIIVDIDNEICNAPVQCNQNADGGNKFFTFNIADLMPNTIIGTYMNGIMDINLPEQWRLKF